MWHQPPFSPASMQRPSHWSGRLSVGVVFLYRLPRNLRALLTGRMNAGISLPNRQPSTCILWDGSHLQRQLEHILTTGNRNKHWESADLLGQDRSLPSYCRRSQSTRFVATWQYALMNVGPWWWKTNPKGSGSLPEPRSGYAAAIVELFAHLLI